MVGDEEYRFKIDAFSPETIPMARLAEYMLEFAKLLAYQDNVHFKDVEAGSTILVSRIEYEAIPKVSRRIDDIHRGAAPDDARTSYVRLNDMLREDNAVGHLTRKPANDDSAEAEILKFPGKEIPRPTKIGPFTERAVIDGELVRIGGKDDTAHVQIVDAEGRTWGGAMTRDLARQLRQYLYEGPILRVEGDARWERTVEGAWELKNFNIKSFQELAKDTLLNAVGRLREIEGTEWNKMEDPITAIREQRKDGDGVH
jgi:hypothetical protein